MIIEKKKTNEGNELVLIVDLVNLYDRFKLLTTVDFILRKYRK